MKLLVPLFILMSLFNFSANAEDSFVKEPYDAPVIESKDQNGNTVSLADVYKKGLTLVYFYPKADTPGCTAQACSLRDAYQQLTDAGIQVIGVSTDGVDKQKKFATKYELPFTLLADADGEVVKAFDVKKIPLIGMATRQAFLIKDGKVVWHDAKASTSEQAADVLEAIKKL